MFEIAAFKSHDAYQRRLFGGPDDGVLFEGGVDEGRDVVDGAAFVRVGCVGAGAGLGGYGEELGGCYAGCPGGGGSWVEGEEGVGVGLDCEVA